MQIRYDIKQKSNEWLKLRAGKMTASNASTIIANGKGLSTYILETMADYYSDSLQEGYINADMERGNELEASARFLYEQVTGKQVAECGIIIYNDYIACSPDGLILDNNKIISGCEYKCPKPSTFLYALLNDYVKPEYYNQCQMNMFITDVTTWDYMVYCPQIKPYYYLKTIQADKEVFAKLKKGLINGTQQIKDYKEKYLLKVGNND